MDIFSNPCSISKRSGQWTFYMILIGDKSIRWPVVIEQGLKYRTGLSTSGSTKYTYQINLKKQNMGTFFPASKTSKNRNTGSDCGLKGQFLVQR